MEITKFEFHKNFSIEKGYLELIIINISAKDVSRVYELLTNLNKEEETK